MSTITNECNLTTNEYNLTIGSFVENEIEEIDVSVQFFDQIQSEEDLEEAIKGLTNPQVIIWFLDRMGLKQKWLDYCSNDLISTIRKVSESCTFFLVDLRNWMKLKRKGLDSSTKVTTSRVIDEIKKLNCSDVKCLDSALFFQFLKECNSDEMLEYAKDVMLKREFIWMKSKSFKPSGVSINESLGGCLLLEDIYEMDTAKSYSGLQYVEGYFYIQEIISRNASSESDDVDLVFLLPNDEYLYYQDESKSFEEDVRNMLMKQGNISSNKKIRITFIPFKWGDEVRERPYLLKNGIPIKKGKLEFLETLKKV